MNRERRSQVRKQTLILLAGILEEFVGVDGGLYQNTDGSQMTDEECEYAKSIAEDEGRRMRARADGFHVEVRDRAKETP